MNVNGCYDSLKYDDDNLMVVMRFSRMPQDIISEVGGRPDPHAANYLSVTHVDQYEQYIM
jgi:hypothetical protein